MLTKFSWPRSCSLPSKTGKGSFMFRYNFAKCLINLYHMFNIIFPCQIFVKSLAKNLIQQLIQYSTNTSLAYWSFLMKTRVRWTHPRLFVMNTQHILTPCWESELPWEELLKGIAPQFSLISRTTGTSRHELSAGGLDRNEPRTHTVLSNLHTSPYFT